jgi:hypothetical protein
MILLLGTLLFTFLSYYFACLASTGTKQKILYTGLFVVFSIALRVVLDVTLNNDYYYYYDFKIFHKPTSFLSFLVNEPYLYSVYAFFTFFFDAKKEVFLAMYWFNFLITTLFFIWLLYRKDVAMWKKMILFVFHYFLFGFVVLRNGPAYMLFALYFYYTFRSKKFNWILITPLMHISSCLLLVTYFHKWKNYFKGLLFAGIFITLFFLVLKPYLASIAAFTSIVSKIEIYSQGMPVVGFMHVLFFLFIFSLFLAGFLLYRKKMFHPILVTTLLFYGVTFFINPVVAHRFSPYVIFALLLFPFDTLKNEKMVVLLNRLTILLFPIFVYTLFNTHQHQLFMDVFIS